MIELAQRCAMHKKTAALVEQLRALGLPVPDFLPTETEEATLSFQATLTALIEVRSESGRASGRGTFDSDTMPAGCTAGHNRGEGVTFSILVSENKRGAEYCL